MASNELVLLYTRIALLPSASCLGSRQYHVWVIAYLAIVRSEPGLQHTKASILGSNGIVQYNCVLIRTRANFPYTYFK